MRAIQKVSLSLLISVVAFSGFAFFAFSGLFDLIEGNFYSPRVQDHYRQLLSESGEIVERYHRNNLERFSSVFDQESFARLFEANQSQANIENRANVVRQLRADHGSFSHLRVVDRNGEQVHFSTRSEDFDETQGERVYRPVDEIDPNIRDLALQSDEGSDVAADPDQQFLVYRVPVSDIDGVWRGTALVYFGTRALAGRLVSAGVLDPGRDIVVIDADGYVFNVPRDSRGAVSEAVSGVWESLSSGDTARLDLNGGIALPFEDSGSLRFAYFLPESELRLGTELEAVVLLGSFSTLFLGMFLLLNIRQESSVVLSERVRRFQIRMLREYLERRDELDWEGKARELERLKPELTRKIKRGIGKVHPEEREQLDDLVERGWNEILEVIGGGRAHSTNSPDMQHLESMLERVISSLGERGHQALPAASGQGEKSASTLTDGADGSDSSSAEAGRSGREDVEVLDSESEGVTEVEEIDEVETEEETDGIASLEAVDEAEELEGTHDSDDVQPLEAVDESDELEARGSADEPDELEAVNEEGELEAVDVSGKIDTEDDVEELDSLDEPDEGEQPADLEELDSLDEPDEGEQPGDLEELDSLDEPDEGEQPGDLEELDSLDEPDEGEQPAD